MGEEPVGSLCRPGCRVSLDALALLGCEWKGDCRQRKAVGGGAEKPCCPHPHLGHLTVWVLQAAKGAELVLEMK